MRKAALIYNPLAGPLNLRPVVHVVADFWRGHGWSVNIEATQYPGHAREIARESVKSGHELVLAAGGDGTLGEIAGGLVDTETIMAPLPAGTGNSFSRELMLRGTSILRRKNLLQACEKLVSGRVQSIDIGCYNGNEHWLLWASVGVDSYVVQHIEPRSKLARRLGGLGYLLLGTPHVRKFPGMMATVTVDGQRFQGEFLMIVVSNCRRYAGGKYLLSPEACLDDGLFEIWMFDGRVGWGIFRYLALIALNRHVSRKDTHLVTGREVTIETNRVIPFHRDGDPAGTTPLHCWVKPGALKLLVPNQVTPSLFMNPGVNF